MHCTHATVILFSHCNRVMPHLVSWLAPCKPLQLIETAKDGCIKGFTAWSDGTCMMTELQLWSVHWIPITLVQFSLSQLEFGPLDFKTAISLVIHIQLQKR